MKTNLLILSGIFCLFTFCSQQKTRPTGLLCELLSQPELSVITNPKPEFSWIVNSDLNNDFQTAYQIYVGTSEADLKRERPVWWNSGKVISGQSSNVEYSGKPLPANSAIYWKVCTWNKNDIASDWSNPQRFNTGNFKMERSWPGESRWAQVELENGDTIWTFENRHPISYHDVSAVKQVWRGKALFFDFGRSAFAVPKIQYRWKPDDSEILTDSIWVLLGEKAVGDSIDQQPGGGIVFRKYPFAITPGSHSVDIELPRYVPRYPHSQVMPVHMPEVAPFRYVEIHSDNPDVKIEKITQRALYYLFDEDASGFSCSDTRLNDIYNLCRYSVKANTFNGDYAASERERMLYEADSYIHQMSHYAVDREFAIARYSLENMIFHATWPTEWIFHTILMAYADYWHTGSTSLIEKYYHELSAKLMLELASDNYLVSTKTGKQTREFLDSIFFNGKELRDIVDWPHFRWGEIVTNEADNYDFTTYNTVVNAFHYKALLAMSEMASAIDRTAEAERFQKRAVKVKEAFDKVFFNSEKGIYVDGDNSTHSSLHANMFPLVFGLVKDENKPRVINYIKSRGMACGVYGANYLLEGLFNEKETEYAMSLLTSDSDRSWLNMLRVGSTMTTEVWDIRYGGRSPGWSHAWSASPAHIIPRKIMGIEPLLPGFEKIRIAPQPGYLEQAECKVPTIKGPVFVRFSQTPGNFEINFTTPVNTTTHIILPQKYSSGTIILNGEKITPEFVGDDLLVVAGSGRNSLDINF